MWIELLDLIVKSNYRCWRELKAFATGDLNARVFGWTVIEEGHPRKPNGLFYFWPLLKTSGLTTF